MINLRYLREQANLSQEKLGELIDVSQQAIYRYEKGEVQASQKVLLKLSKVFSVPINVLVDDDINVTEYTIKGGSMLSDEEKLLVEEYRKLDEDGKERIMNLLNEKMKKSE